MDIEKLKSQKSIKELINFGIINIDKPLGPTSFSVTDYVRKTLDLNKCSHLGTLDPTTVSGVLPILLGRACRLSDYLMHKDKTYVGIIRLHKEDVTDNKLKEAISKFIGKIKQLPPVRSAVKRAVREREVKSFNVLERNGKEVLFETEVQAGTYIRRICDDVGKELGGAHMLELRRIQASIFKENDEIYPSINLYDFEKAVNSYKEGNEEPLRKLLMPAEEAILKIMPTVQIKKNIKQILTGKPLMKGDISSLPDADIFSLFQGDKFIAIMRKSNEGNIIARPEFVFN